MVMRRDPDAYVQITIQVEQRCPHDFCEDNSSAKGKMLVLSESDFPHLVQVEAAGDAKYEEFSYFRKAK